MQTEKIIRDKRLPQPPPPPIELADILRGQADAYTQHYPVSSQQRKVIRDILNCRTPSLGGHLETCENRCGYQRLSFHSCRNRHCPKCQSLNKIRWVLQRSLRLLPTRYFHLVLSLPHQLNPLLLANQRLLYDLFFESASKALLELATGWPKLKALPGFTAILHTWNQELHAHCHLHIVVTSGGLNTEGSQWLMAKNNFLVPVRALAKLLRAKFLDGLQELFSQEKLIFSQNIQDLKKPPAFKRFIRNLKRIKWYAYSKPPFENPRQVFSYLGHYTHRTAISNKRLISFDGLTVTFRARNNNQPGTYRLVRLPAQEFIRRFLLHVLPPGFVRIRHFGLLAARNSHSKWKMAYCLLTADEHANPFLQNFHHNLSAQLLLLLPWQLLLRQITGFDPTVCPACGAKLRREPIPSFSFPTLDSS